MGAIRRERDDFQVTLLFQIPAAGTLNNVALLLTQDAVFEIRKRTVVVYDAADAPIAGGADQILADQITPRDENRPWNEFPIPLSNYAGTGQLPYILPVPVFVTPSTAISHNFTNLNAAIRRVRLTYHGVKHYDSEGRARTVVPV